MLERGRRFPFPLCCPWFCSLRYCIHVVWVSLWLPLGRWGSLLFRAVSVYYVFSLSVCTVVYRRPLSFLGLGYVSAGVVVVGWGCSFGPVTWRAFCFFPFSPCVAPFLLLLDSSRSRAGPVCHAPCIFGKRVHPYSEHHPSAYHPSKPFLLRFPTNQPTNPPPPPR